MMVRNKILKATIVCEFGFFMLATATCIVGAGGASIYYDVKKNAMRSENRAGYEEFNDAFKQSKIDDLTVKLQNKEISQEQFDHQSASLEDYSFEDYMLKQTAPQVANEYSDLVSQSSRVVQTIGCVSAAELGLSVLAEISRLAIDKTQKKEDGEQPTSPTTADCKVK